jgi:hypothetical protein
MLDAIKRQARYQEALMIPAGPPSLLPTEQLWQLGDVDGNAPGFVPCQPLHHVAPSRLIFSASRFIVGADGFLITGRTG